MPLSAKEIKSKINSVGNIKQITRAMELLSVTKMKTATKRVTASREYAQRARELILAIANNETILHPLVKQGEGNKTLAILVSSNKGLCGAFNANVAKRAREFVNETETDKIAPAGGGVDFVAVGKYSAKEARRMDREFIATFNDYAEDVTVQDIRPLAHLLIEKFKEGEYSDVVVIYTHFVSALSYKPLVRRLLPIDPYHVGDTIDSSEQKNGEPEIEISPLTQYMFEPSEDELLDLVLPRLTEVRLYQAMLESQASEHSARMFAMKNATENAEEMKDELTLSYNRARQAQVTSEIAEISSAADALSG